MISHNVRDVLGSDHDDILIYIYRYDIPLIYNAKNILHDNTTMSQKNTTLIYIII